MQKQPHDVLKDFVFRHCDELLSEYIEGVRSGYFRPSSKEVNDAVWGTVALSPIEVLLVDSPLVQRLRYVRQIGVAHWVYPCAGHTRFEHTLGVLHQTRELVASLNHYAVTTSKTGEVISSQYSQLLCMCAIMHDVGHGAFSHVSENALMNFEVFKKITASFSDTKGGETNKLSEIFAYYAVESPAFKKLLREISSKVDAFPKLAPAPADNIEVVVSKMQDAIIGLPILDRIPQLQELINGPFDADKLDYLSRDAKQSGVPTLVDISRLSQKLVVHDVPLADVPETIARRIEGDGSSCYLFGIRSSGAAVLDELHLGRTMLFNKIYRHQKIKALEAMLESLFRVVAEVASDKQLLKFAYHFCDDEILSLKTPTLSGSLRTRGLRVRSDKFDLVAVAGDLAGRIRRRDLFVRAFAIQPRYPSDPLEKHDKQILGLQALVNDLSNPTNVKALKDKVVEELARILGLCAPEILQRYKAANLYFYVSIIPPNQPPGGTEIDRALLFPVGGRPTPYSESIFNTGNWSRFYADKDGAAGYVFAPRDLCQYAYLACEAVVNEMYGVVIPSSAIELSKHIPNEIIGLKEMLFKAKYYEGKSYYLRPYPARLRKGDVPRKLQEAARKLSSVQEPSLDEVSVHFSLTLEERIELWLRQFETDDMIDCALSVLDQFVVLSRQRINENLSNFFDAFPLYSGATLSGLGGLKDSSAVVGYYSDDLGRDRVSGVLSVDDLTKAEGTGPIVFVDDVLGSGGQATDILGNWFGAEDVKNANLNEERLPLFSGTQAMLKSRKLAFVFVAGWDEGKEKLLRAIEALELDAVVYCGISEQNLPFAFSGRKLHTDPNVVERFRRKCDEIGKSLLLSSGMKPEKVAGRTLGYGNRAMLLSTPYNVPSQTLTCIWSRGKYSGVEWQPLLLRRKKN